MVTARSSSILLSSGVIDYAPYLVQNILRIPRVAQGGFRIFPRVISVFSG
jgi:hypothetical protein